MKKRQSILTILGVLILSFGISTLISFNSMRVLIEDNKEEQANAFATELQNEIRMKFVEPNAISKSINNEFTQTILTNRTAYTNEERERIFTQYLDGIVQYYDYDSAFIVDGADGRCYSDTGFLRIIDASRNEIDRSFEAFVNSGEKFTYEITSNMTYEDGLMVFAYCRIESEEGKYLGTCGLGNYVDDIQSLMSKFERKNRVKAVICSEDGNCQIAVQEPGEEVLISKEEKELIASLDESKSYSYKKTKKGGYYIAKYIPETNWYLIIKDSERQTGAYDNLILWNVIGCVSVLFFVVMIINIYLMHVTKNDEMIRKAEEKQRNIVMSLADIYHTMHEFDLKNGTCTELSTNDIIHEIYMENEKYGIQATINAAIRKTTQAEYLSQMLEFINFTTLPYRLKNQKIISQEFCGNYNGWIRASFINISQDKDGFPTEVLYVTQIIENDKRKEEQLIQISKTDSLTGLFNRRAYEDDISEIKEHSDWKNLVVVSVDVNGLKVANDKFGHEAGDELIRGAANCLLASLGKYGRVYRTGGDEFMALLHCEKDDIKEIRKDLKKNMEAWSGVCGKLSIAKGIVSCDDHKDKTIEEIERMADRIMYEDKKVFYRQIKEGE